MDSGSSAVSNSFVSPYSNQFVSQSGWWCPAPRLSPIHLSPHITIHLSPCLAGGVRLFGCLQFICLHNSFVSSLACGVWLSGCLQLICLPYSNLVCHFDWWCRALRIFPIHLSPLTAIHLSPSLAGGVRLSGCLQLICLPL